MRDLGLERVDAIEPAEQLVLQLGLIGALHAEALARGTELFEMRFELLAQLRGFGFGACDGDVALRVGDARALVELLDATLGGRERVAQLFDHRRRRRYRELSRGRSAWCRRRGGGGRRRDRNRPGGFFGDVLRGGLRARLRSARNLVALAER